MASSIRITLPRLSQSASSSRSKSQRSGSRMGLRMPLLLLLVAAAIVYMGSAVFNEKSMRQFYGTHQLPGGIDFDISEPFDMHTPKTNKALPRNRTMVPFEKQDGIVIATKIHGPHQLILLRQSLCLLHFAYNRRPLYDIIVFTTLSVPDEDIASVRALVHPARLTFVIDNRGLQEEIAALSKPRYDALLKACGVESPVNLTWWSNCPGRIAYNWQAEFRAWHIWRHPSLANYSYMMWVDSDAFCTEVWTVDPIQAVIENNLVILFDNWPMGSPRGPDVDERIYKAFGRYLCDMNLDRGHLMTNVSNTTCQGSPRLGDIHGFFRITNLDFYRSDLVQKWAETWIGDGFLQRLYDDQAGVTIPAAILAPDRAWDMRQNKIRLNVYHNSDLDGKSEEPVGGFKKYWRTTVINQFPDAAGICPIEAAG